MDFDFWETAWSWDYAVSMVFLVKYKVNARLYEDEYGTIRGCQDIEKSGFLFPDATTQTNNWR